MLELLGQDLKLLIFLDFNVHDPCLCCPRADEGSDRACSIDLSIFCAKPSTQCGLELYTFFNPF